MQGEGKGNIDPNGTNACTAMVGQYPAALIEAGFKGETAPLFVTNMLKLRFMTPSVTITVVQIIKRCLTPFLAIQNTKTTGLRKTSTARSKKTTSSVFVRPRLYGDAELTDKQQQAYQDMADKAKDRIMDNVKKYISTRNRRLSNKPKPLIHIQSIIILSSVSLVGRLIAITATATL